MPGGPQQVRAEEGAVCKGFFQRCVRGVYYSLAERPFRPRVILCLNCPQIIYHLIRFLERRCSQPLIVKPSARDFWVVHGGQVYPQSPYKR